MNLPNENLPYRPCVGIMLVNADGMVFVAQRLDTPGNAWQMPQGGIDEGEDPITAVRRELKEETGIENAEIIAQSDRWRRYDLPDDLIGRLWGGKYRGQTQMWFALRFQGADEEIDIEIGEHAEFSTWKWVPIDDLVNLIVPFKRELYMDVVAEFRHLAISR